MDRQLPTESLTVAVLASRLDPLAAERLDAVLAWTESGTRHYQPLPATPIIDDHEHSGGLQGLDHTTLTASPPTSSGLTWRTWALPTIPPALRHLSPDQAVRALAHALRRMPA